MIVLKMRMKLHKSPTFRLFALIILVTLSSCEKKAAVREYDETFLDSTVVNKEEFQRIHAPFLNGSAGGSMDMSAQSGDMKDMLQKSVSSVPLAWDVPEGWGEQKGSGMRLVTFTSENGMECSITSLAGTSGGLKANAMRWIGQLQITTGSDAAIDDFLAKSEQRTSKGNLPYTILDFTKLQGSADAQTSSMISAVMELPQSTVFIKMTGTKTAVSANFTKFESLCQSLRLKNE